MKLKKLFKYLVLLIPVFFITLKSFAEEEKCGSKLITHIYQNTSDKYFHYNENRNDAGVYFEFKWDREQKKIIINRNKENYPIVGFSFFDNKNLTPSKTVIKKINSEDLSALSDKDKKN